MGLIQTFRQAFKLRLAQLQNEGWVGKKVYYRKKLRLIVRETSDKVTLKGVKGEISKSVLENHKKTIGK